MVKMTSVIIVDKEIENIECLKEGDRDLYIDIVNVLTDCEIINEFAINVSDKTWNEIKDDSIKRLNLNEDEFKRYLENANYIFVYKNGKYKLCIHK
jgi:hypothetical protein